LGEVINKEIKLLETVETEENINQIKVCCFKDNDYLACLGNDAKITIFSVSKLTTKGIIILDNTYQECDDNGTWSIDYCKSKEIIAVGSNSNRISMWYLKDIQTYLKNKISNENEPEPKRHCIIAHDHNIPFISFSPCGEFIASISIDDTCRIHHVDTKKLVS